MRSKVIPGLIILGTLIFIFPQLAFSADICFQNSYGVQFYLDFNVKGRGLTGYTNPHNCPVMGSWAINGDEILLDLDVNCYCGDGANPAKYVTRLSMANLSGPAWAHAFRCDGTIDMFDSLSFSPCGSTTEEIQGPTPIEE